MKRSLLITTLVGAVIVVLIVTGATIWMSAGARSATDRAVEKVRIDNVVRQMLITVSNSANGPSLIGTWFTATPPSETQLSSTCRLALPFLHILR